MRRGASIVCPKNFLKAAAKAIGSAYISKMSQGEGGNGIRLPLMIEGLPKGFERLLMEQKVGEKALKVKWVWEIELEDTGIDSRESSK